MSADLVGSRPDDGVSGAGIDMTLGPRNTETAISVRGLHMSYGSFEAVAGIDLEVRRGEIVAFLGPNGAGKTTTVEILEGYRKRTSGTVSVLGEDPETAPLEWRDRIGVVLQESEIEPHLTAKECVRLYAGYHLHPRPAMEILNLVGLGDKADSQSRELSGGQRRRLDVALGLVGDPELVFMDEPTTGFDPSARRQAWEVIAGLRSLGKTIFLTTHYMDEAEHLADRIIVISKGRIVAEGSPSTLGGRDRRPAGVSFRLEQLDGASRLPDWLQQRGRILGNVVQFESTNPLADLAAVDKWAREQGVSVAELRVSQPTVEDIYLELTGEPSVKEAEGVAPG